MANQTTTDSPTIAENQAADNSATDSKDTSGDAGAAEVQAKKDVEEQKGYHGYRTDPTPLEHYTLPGVLAGKPTPETDRGAAAAALAARLGHKTPTSE